MKMTKRLLAVLMTLAMLLPLLPALPVHAEIVESGKCGADGDNLTWTLDSDGLLTISGVGKMNDWTGLASPFAGRHSDLKNVAINIGVTSVGDYAFESCHDLKSVTIPESVTSIGKAAFDHCNDLISVTIPDSVRSIGDFAFYSNFSLTSVTIPNGVTSIGEGTFWGCAKMTNIMIPDSVTCIGDFAFANCTGLTNLTIPDSVTSIGKYAFFNCECLTSVIIPNSVTSIGERAFESCTGLTSMTIPDSVTSIGYAAFESCTGLTSVTIPNSVTSIGQYVFYNCRELNIYFQGTEAQWKTVCKGELGTDDVTIHYGNITIDPSEDLNEDEDQIDSYVEGVLEDFDAIESDVVGEEPYLTTVTIDGTTYDVKAHKVSDGFAGMMWNKKVIVCLAKDVVVEMKEPEPDTRPKFKRERDNNSFAHYDGALYDSSNNKLRDPNGNIIYTTEAEALANSIGFYKIRNYNINDVDLKARLFNYTAHNGQLDDLLKQMNKEWDGSCYGIAETIAMVFLGYQDLNDITGISAKDFYHLELPYKNSRFLDTINYYQLSQIIKSYGTKSSGCTQTLLNWNGWLSHPQGLSHTYLNSDFWQLLINEVNEKYMVLLGFGEKDGSGHVVVTCGIERTSKDKYTINLYDENGRNSFQRLEIERKGNSYSATYLCDANHGSNNILGELTYMYYLPLDSVVDLVPTSRQANRFSNKTAPGVSNSDNMELTIPLFGSYEIRFNDGNFIRLKDDNFDTSVTISDMQFIVEDNKSFVRLTLEKKDCITMTSTIDDITVYDDNHYFSVNGTNIDTTTISFSDGITLEGNNYTFTASIDCDETGAALKRITGESTDTVTIKDNATTVIQSDDGVYNSTIERFTTDKNETLLKKSDYSKAEAKPDGTIELKNTSSEPKHLRGDANLDGKVLANDARLVLRASAKLETLTGQAFINCDLNGDGKLLAGEARKILRYSAKLEPTLDPAEQTPAGLPEESAWPRSLRAFIKGDYLIEGRITEQDGSVSSYNIAEKGDALRFEQPDDHIAALCGSVKTMTPFYFIGTIDGTETYTDAGESIRQTMEFDPTFSYDVFDRANLRLSSVTDSGGSRIWLFESARRHLTIETRGDEIVKITGAEVGKGDSEAVITIDRFAYGDDVPDALFRVDQLKRFDGTMDEFLRRVAGG